MDDAQLQKSTPLSEITVGERCGEWGKQVGSMSEAAITFNYTNQETV